MAWTDGEVETLEMLVDENHTFGEIARKLNKTKNSCIGKAHRLGLQIKVVKKPGPKNMRPPKEKSDKIILGQIKKHSDKWGWGLELEEIMEFTGLSFNVVRGSLTRLLKSSYINKTKSNVAEHIFYNDASLVQRGV